MQYLFRSWRWLVLLLIGFGSNGYAVFNAVDIEIDCENDNWNDIEDSNNATINNICKISLLDKETVAALMALLEKLDLNKPAKTAVKGAIQGFKEELEGNLKPLIAELKDLLKEGTDQAGKLIGDVDKRLEKRIAQISKEIRDTAESFKNSVKELIQQTEKSVINIIKGAEESTKGVIKQTEESTARIIDDMVAHLNSVASKLNNELSKKFETIRNNIKTDIMFIGDYFSCKSYGATITFEKAVKNVLQTLPFTNKGQKPCQDCKGLISSVKERFYPTTGCNCCEKAKLINSGDSPMKLFRYYVCMRKSDINGYSPIRSSTEYSIIDVYTDINERSKEVYCVSDMTKGGKKLLQERMIEEAEQAYKDYLFWKNVSK